MTKYDTKKQVYLCLVCGRLFRSNAKIPRCTMPCHSSRVVESHEVPKDMINESELIKLRKDFEDFKTETEDVINKLIEGANEIK